MVEVFVALALSLDDGDGLLLVGLLHGDLLEETGQLLVLLNVLRVSVDGRGDDHLQLVLREQLLQAGQDAVQRRLLVLYAVEVLDDEKRLRLSHELFGNLLEAVFDLAFVADALRECDEVELIGLQGLERCSYLAGTDAL